MLSPQQFQTDLLQWYDQYGRKNLPWRQNITAYRVWLSEIMLQQTQVKTVIPYFENFIHTFPTIETLAQAQEDEVLHMWTGLGYYSRARNLFKTAKIIVSEYGGQFPRDFTAINNLPGIGKSTAGAILSIAYNQPAAILDGNVRRIFSRLHCADNHSTHTMWSLAEQFTPNDRNHDYSQAIMDLGATICTPKNPKCDSCPVKQACKAFKDNKVAQYPIAKPRKVSPIKTTSMIIFYDRKNQAVLLEKRPPVGIWGGLWSFPECEINTTDVWITDRFNFCIKDQQLLNVFTHTFSHFKLKIQPILVEIEEGFNKLNVSENCYSWHYLYQSNTLKGFASPVKRLLEQLVLKKLPN
jgi:A/G-specific adenine glycosylase